MSNEYDDLTIISSSQSQSISLTDQLTKKGSNVDVNKSSIITDLLKTKSDEYIVVAYKKKKSSKIWLKFGLPAKKKKDSDDYDIIPNYSSCLQCKQTYRFTNASTSSMNDHKCPRELLDGQQQMTNFITSSSPLRSTLVHKSIKQKKEIIKNLLVRWIVSGMRPFQIVSDPGLVNIIQECLDIGRELHSEKIKAEEILCCDRTIRNELSKLATIERQSLSELLKDCAQVGRLSISPDIWTDNYRKIAYLGATAHLVDENYEYQSIDLFCTEFREKKSGENIEKLMREQLSIYEIESFMDLITFVTDRGSNFIKGLREFRVMFCVAHRLNGILKKTFFQTSTLEKKSPMKVQSFIANEMTPIKVAMNVPQLSPEIAFNDMQDDDEEKHALEQWNREEEAEEDDTMDYATLPTDSIPWSAREVLETIQQCKILVQYVKKTSLNRQIQLLKQEDDDNEEQKSSLFTTIHQSSKIRWLSMSDLLRSIKRSYEPLRRLLNELKQCHRIDKINMSIVEQLIDFLRPWQNVLKEVQTGNAPSLHVVFPCINYLQEELRKIERTDKTGMKFFAKRSLSLLNSMFHIEDEYILATFLHPNFKKLLSATSAQRAECYRACRVVLPKIRSTLTINVEEEPPSKRQRRFLDQLMDDEMMKTKTNTETQTTKDELDIYIDFPVNQDKNYSNPLLFWKENQNVFPNLSKLASRVYAVPCSSAAVEREFSAAGQIVNQRRSNLDPTTVNDIMFLRSMENNNRKKID